MAAFFTNLRLKVTVPARSGRETLLEELYRVDMEIDERELMMELGQRAVQNRSRKTRLAGGLIRVEVRKL